ncbi:hypothetical protein DM01DRAFT_1091223 [Hesseltinella vesiculosa]|uniref:Nudix hydrolase domain-containing protein n=1 Tax=Hesseltinella vesiculosa TaxID=101127 RepID=A0A1X2GCV1_9FUNG|nr:hypothetical protein DM01DRAFT_1091223 [Hesseltinella vesiculosa]
MISDRHILQRVNDHFDRHAYQHIASPPTQPRRAGVAAILRWHSSNPSKDLAGSAPVQSLDDFWQLPWVKNDEHGRLELLFMLRATRAGDRFSNHVAFPGGKNEPGETDKDTVVREVQEEIGLDLASKDFLLLGTLDDRELTSTYDRKLLMILVPFVYLQVVPETPEMTLEAGEVAAVDCK